MCAHRDVVTRLRGLLTAVGPCVRSAVMSPTGGFRPSQTETRCSAACIRVSVSYSLGVCPIAAVLSGEKCSHERRARWQLISRAVNVTPSRDEKTLISLDLPFEQPPPHHTGTSIVVLYTLYWTTSRSEANLLRLRIQISIIGRNNSYHLNLPSKYRKPAGWRWRKRIRADPCNLWTASGAFSV